jgi:WD40 repeat protein
MVSLVLGVVALRRIRRSQGMLTGRGFAVGGICVSSACLLFVAAIVALPIGIAVLNQPAATLTEAWRIDGSPSDIEQQPDAGDMAYGAEGAGPGIIEQLAYSSDGELLVGRGNSLYVWDAGSGRERQRISDLHFVGRFVVDGDRLRAVRLSDSGSPSVAEIDLRSGGTATLATPTWGDDYVLGAELSSRGGGVAAVFNEDTIWAWEADTGETISQFRIPEVSGGEPIGYIDAVALSPDGRLALVAQGSRRMLLVDVQRAAEIRRFEPPPDLSFDTPTMLLFLPDGKMALSVHGGSSVSAILWDVEGGADQRRLEGHRWGSASAAVSADGQFIVTGGRTAGDANYFVLHGQPRDYGGDVILRKTDGARELATFYKDGTSRVTALALSPDGRRVAAAYADGTLIVLDTGR